MEEDYEFDFQKQKATVVPAEEEKLLQVGCLNYKVLEALGYDRACDLDAFWFWMSCCIEGLGRTFTF